MKQLQKRLVKAQKGATMVEYAIMVALIAAIAIATVVAIGQQVDDGFEQICTQINENNGDAPDVDCATGE